MSKKVINTQKNIIIILLFILVLMLGILFSVQVSALEDAESNAAATASELQAANAELTAKDSQLVVVTKQLELSIVDKKQQEQEINSLLNDVAKLEAEMFNSPQAIGVVLTTRDVEAIAKTVWGEGRGVSKLEQSLIIWCILNRVDAGQGSIYQVVTKPNQFYGYHPNNPVEDDIVALVQDVIARWQLEKVCTGEVGRTLPADYLWFHGDGTHNWFRNAYRGDFDTWDWNSVWNPYA